MPLRDGPPLKRNLILAYGTGQIIEIMILGVVATFLLIYLTSVCGLRPDVAGLVLLISLAVDAVLDPLIGATSDGWKSRWGRRHPFMIVGFLVLPIAIVGVFILPTGLPASWVFGYVLVFNIIMRVSTALFVLPYAALLPELSSDYAERARMMIYRLILAVVAWAATLAFQGWGLPVPRLFVRTIRISARRNHPDIRVHYYVWNAFSSASDSPAPGRASATFQILYGSSSAVSQPVICRIVFRRTGIHDGVGFPHRSKHSRTAILLEPGT